MEKQFTIEELEQLVESIAVNKCHLNKRAYTEFAKIPPYIYIEPIEDGLEVEAVSQLNEALHSFIEKLSTELADSNYMIVNVSNEVRGNVKHRRIKIVEKDVL